MNVFNQIIQGDAFQKLGEFESNSIDFIITSPPYDDLREYGGHVFNFEGIAKQLFRVLKDGCVMVWIVGDKTKNGNESGTSFKQALYFKEIGFKLHDTMIYRKFGSTYPNLLSFKRYIQCFEYMFVLTKGSLKKWNPLIDRKNKYPNQKNKTHVRNKDKLEYRNREYTTSEYGLRYNIWDFSNTSQNKDFGKFEHPAMFPEQLAEDHIKTWSNENDLILDPFIGSGTVAKMALKNNRRFLGIELNEDYIKIANKRIEPYLYQRKLSS